MNLNSTFAYHRSMCDTTEENDEMKNSSADNFPSIPDDDREMAISAFQDFEQKNYEQCLATLKKLYSKRPQDSKVFHNTCVAEFYSSQCKKVEYFNNKLLEVCKHAHIDVHDLEAVDDVDNCVILYNHAVILYNLHQFNVAINILDKVFQFVEPLDEMLAKNICFLLLELYLCVYQPKKALCLIGYIETMPFSGNKNCGKLNQKEDNSDNANCDALKRRLQLCKARCYAMMKTSKACKREIKNLMSTGSAVQNIAAFYLKSQLEYQRGNYRKALKLLNSINLPDDISAYYKETGDCLQAIFYNNVGCIHFYMGKPYLGQFYIQKALTELNQELEANIDTSKSERNSCPLHLLGISTKHQLIYNLGMQYLQGQNFHDAFDCFIKVLGFYYSNPRLWLRIAECCIHIHKPDNVNHFTEYKDKSFIKTTVGSGIHRKLILNPTIPDQLTSGNSKSSIEVLPTLQFAILALKNALALLPENSLQSFSKDSSSNLQSSLENDINSSEENATLSTLPSNFLQNAEIISLRNSVLIACSYVSLCLGDVILAYEYAKALLNQPKISNAHKFLAHQYAGEALLLMDRITEAVDHLNFQHANNIELAFSTSSTEISLKHQMRFDSKVNEKYDDGSRPVGNMPNWLPNSINSARFVSQYNLAVAYALREEWGKATECIFQMNPNGNVFPQAYSLLIYVHYHQGATDEAKRYLKLCFNKV